jgi:AcrR family transcriptional regulator
MNGTAQPNSAAQISIDKVLTAALDLFSRQGYGATSMRQIAKKTGLSVGNVYHHFSGKKAIYEEIFRWYWQRLQDPDLPHNRIYADPDFPNDLEQLADALEQYVEDHKPFIMLIYVDVIEFGGEHVRDFYTGLAAAFAKAYGPSIERAKQQGRFGDVDPLMAVMVAARWLVYFFTVEKCFGAPGHLGMEADQAVKEFIRILKYGVLPRP